MLTQNRIESIVKTIYSRKHCDFSGEEERVWDKMALRSLLDLVGAIVSNAEYAK